MDLLIRLFDINTIAFTILEYPMSWLEFVGTLLNLVAVWLVTRNHILTWPVGNVAVILFAVLFYQIQLYSDMIEQLYFLITGFYGWWVWHKLARDKVSPVTSSISPATPLERSSELELDSSIRLGGSRERISWIVLTIAGTAVMTHIMSRVHLWFPNVFSAPASFPVLDAFTTVLSFVANIVMAHKRIECWIMWIIVDVIGVGLYYSKHVLFVALLYFIFLILATKGFLRWRALMVKEAT